MSTIKTIATVILSAFLGALTFFIASPKKVLKKKDRSVSRSFARENKRDDLFI